MVKIKKSLKNFLAPGKNEHEPDKLLIALVGIVLIFGLIILSSATSVIAYNRFGDSYYYFNSQLVSVILGVFVFFIFSKINYTFWKKYAVFFLAVSCFLLLLVFIPGLAADYEKARRWINIFGFSLQPSEFVKIFFLIYLAAWLERRKEDLGSISTGIGPFLFVLAAITFLMFLQPDIGTLSVVLGSSLIVYFVGGGKILHLIVVSLIGCSLLFGAYQTMPYIQDRFKCFVNPQLDTRDVCYQVNQSLIAVGSGGWWGRGIGESRQKFAYLPEISGDSIFSIMAEEVGFVWSSLLIFLYFLIFYRGVRIARYAADRFGQLLAVGIVSWIMLQTLLNIGGMINIIPMTGVPLPLFSYGGSAILATLMALGILVNISKYTTDKK